MVNFINQIFNSFTKTERQIFWGSLLIFLASGILWAILIFQTATIEVPVESQIYREGVIGQPIAINPVIAGTNDVDRDLIELLFSGLIDLSESYKVSPDGQTWNVTLKSNLRWSDGKPITSDDILFTIDAIQNPNSRSPLFLTWQGIVVNRISEREVEFALRTPYAFFLDNLKGFRIIPRHIFGAIPVENFRLSEFNLEPVGSGPYRFISSEKRKDGFITGYKLATNEHFSLEKPFIKEFEVKFYPSTAEAIDAFNQKRIDGLGGISPKNLGNLKLSHQILEIRMPQYYAIFFNKSAAPNLEDPDLIRALSLATDKKRIIDEVFLGRASIVNQPILPVMDGYDISASPMTEFSIEEAVSLLEDDQWELNEENNIRTKKVSGQEKLLEFSIVVPQISFLTETIEIIKADWAKAGISLKPIFLNPADVTNEVIKTRNYQMIIFGNILRSNPDIFSFWHSSERFYPGLNLALYNNKKVDSLLESTRKNFDPESRGKELSELQNLISKDMPAIFLYSPTYLYVGPKNLGGFEERVINTPADRFKNVHRWYLKTTRIFK